MQHIANVERRSHKELNNRSENCYLPLQTRQGFRSIGFLQQFMSVFSTIRTHIALPQANRSVSQIRVLPSCLTLLFRVPRRHENTERFCLLERVPFPA